MYTSMVIAGGAMKAMACIGVAKYLEERSLLKHIKNFVGTSAGSIMCLTMVLGYSWTEMKQFLVETLADESSTAFDIEKLFSIMTTYGMNDGSGIGTAMGNLIYKKFHLRDITFIELAKASGKNLVVCVSNLTKETPEYFSVDTTPNLSVVKAIIASCSIPILFEPVHINGCLYLDGGLYNNFPIDYFSDHKLKDILGINIVFKNYQKHDTFGKYLRFLFNSVVERFNNKITNSKDKNIVTLEFEDEEGWFSIDEVKIRLSDEKLEEYINIGYNACFDI
jgi:predicted acylesterase/phospholipase RssA